MIASKPDLLVIECSIMRVSCSLTFLEASVGRYDLKYKNKNKNKTTHFITVETGLVAKGYKTNNLDGCKALAKDGYQPMDDSNL